MSNRFALILAGIVLMVAAAFTVSANATPKLTGSTRVSDYYERPYVNYPSSQPELARGSDWFERHPEALNAANTVDLSDYYGRHPGAVIAVQVGASDWFERHPEALIAANTVDLSDYFQRHPSGSTRVSDYYERPEVIAAANAAAAAAIGSDWIERHPEALNAANLVDWSDYFKRHPEVLKSGGAADLSDWFQRHPESVGR